MQTTFQLKRQPYILYNMPLRDAQNIVSSVLRRKLDKRRTSEHKPGFSE